MASHGQRLVVALLLLLVPAVSALAQQTPQDEKIQQLEQKLDELLRQAESIRQELNQLKPAAPAESEDLTQIGVTNAAETQPASEAQAAPEKTAGEAPAAPTLTDVQPVENPSNTAASKALNPDISVIGNFIGHALDQNPYESLNAIGDTRSPIALDEVEVAYEAFVDPYAKGKFFISVGPDEIDVEEGYAQFVALPWGLTAKAGKTKATFGKANTWHTHVRPWVDQPLMVSRFLGEEGVADVGLSVSRDVPNPFGAFTEVTGEVYSGDVENVFGRRSDNDLLYNAHFKFFKDITENSNIELGTSWMRGGLPDTDVAGHNRLAGVDATYRWKPLAASIYHSFVARFEGVADQRSDFDRNLYGWYASADYQLGQRWFTGVRLDSADRFLPLNDEAIDGRRTDHALSATLTFWPSEFSQVRGQLRRTRFENGPSFNEFLIQLQFAIGAHGAHAF
ncbi:MAG TPA: hypothetical protein VFN10_00860 [Thermoanaerobaculia bacterium]|nr:hypothetical protein [Thermoanaerobaculia bacterium]